MLFVIIYNERPGVEKAERPVQNVSGQRSRPSLSRLLSWRRRARLFKNWTPPAGFEFKSHHAFADRNGGVAIVDVDSPETLMEALTPFQAFNELTATPIVDVDTALDIYEKTLAWSNTVY